MESALSRHLGMSKKDLHNALKNNPEIGRKIDENTGKVVYDSIADIQDADEMLARIFEFQHWAAIEHKYEFEPYNDEDEEPSHEVSVSRLLPDLDAPGED